MSLHHAVVSRDAVDYDYRVAGGRGQFGRALALARTVWSVI